MLEDVVTEDLVDLLPVSSDQTLLVQVDEVALNLLRSSFMRNTTGQVITNLSPLDLLE